MTDTKENILITALRLFAQNGYEAVPVSKIAGELGMTKGALYKHYKNKLDIFDSIFDYVCKLDIQRSQKAGVPEKDFEDMPKLFGGTSVESVTTYMADQFDYWTQDEVACHFRRMVTLEQYRCPEMTAFYQKVLTSGPVTYLENLFREMMVEGVWRDGSPKEMAVEFYAPFYLLLSLFDAAADKAEKESIKAMFKAHIKRFVAKYAEKKIENRNPFKESNESCSFIKN